MSAKDTKENPVSSSEKAFDEYRNKEDNRFIRRVWGWIVLFLVAAALIVSLFLMSNRVESVDDKVKNMTDSSCQMKILIDSTAKDTIHFISRQDVQIMVNDAADKKTSAYVDQQGNLLALYVGIMAIFAVLFTVAVPLMINNRQQDRMERWADQQMKEHKEKERELEDKQNNLENELRKTKTTTNDSIEKVIKEYQSRIDALNRNDQKPESNRDNITDPSVNMLPENESQKDSEAKENDNYTGSENCQCGQETLPETQLKKSNERQDVQEKTKELEKEAAEKIQKIAKEGESRIALSSTLVELNKENKETRFEKLLNETKHNDSCPAIVYYELGVIYGEKNSLEESIAAFEIAIEKLPDYAEAHYELAKILLRKGQDSYNDAWLNIEKAIALRPEDSGMIKTRCEIFKAMGLLEEARKDAEKGLIAARKEGNIPQVTLFKSILNEVLAQQVSNDDNLIEDITVQGVTFQMIKINKGIFTMCEMDGAGTHRVLLEDYYIGETVVTQSLWGVIMGDNPSHFLGDNCPVERVSWNDVTQKFIPRLNRMTGRKFRLPTEAEWEYAARGGNKSKVYKYSGSNDIDEVAWYGTNSGDRILEEMYDEGNWDKIEKNNGKTHPVKEKKPNELGLYDMSGNVWELCQDWYDDYNRDPQINPAGPDSGWYRVCRGGCWGNPARLCRVVRRDQIAPDSCTYAVGFRLALSPSLPQEEKKA